MSFMGDLGMIQSGQYASEATFLNLMEGMVESNVGSKTAGPLDTRTYWKNGLKLLKQFIVSEYPIAIGLQEMNLTSSGSGTGSDAVDKMLRSVNLEFGKHYHQVCAEISGSKGRPAVSIILDVDVLGSVIETKVVNNPANFDNKSKPAQGRPLLIVMTGNNNVLVCLHGAQDPSLTSDIVAFNNKIILYTSWMINEVEKFVAGRSVKNIFVMGDFNDRYDAVKLINITGKRLGYQGSSPYSCCHNWDSSCTKSRYKQFPPFSSQNGKKLDKYGTCTVDVVHKKTDRMEREGFIENYRYKGDKVFGSYPAGPIAIYGRPNKHLTSTESDHELVYAKYKLTGI